MNKWVMAGRMILTGFLLAEVWRHSHWSVALSLTLLFVSIEVGHLLARGEIHK